MLFQATLPRRPSFENSGDAVIVQTQVIQFVIHETMSSEK
jgi:hypothetical protein